jgi:hypothetical protein
MKLKNSRRISLSETERKSRTNDTLPDATDYTSRHQYELGHGWLDVALDVDYVDRDQAWRKFAESR